MAAMPGVRPEAPSMIPAAITASTVMNAMVRGVK